jgi:hypothetical protein
MAAYDGPVRWSTRDWVIAAALVVAGFLLRDAVSPWIWRIIVLGVFIAYPGRIWWRRQMEHRRHRQMPPEYHPPPGGGSSS